VVIVRSGRVVSTGCNTRLDRIVPDNDTAAAAPVVEYLMSVRVPSAQSVIAVPAVVLFEQPPVPVDWSSL
jgi:hypothetical protein